MRPESALLNKSSCLAAALGFTKFITIVVTNWVTLSFAAQVQIRCSFRGTLTKEGQFRNTSSLY